MPSFAMLAAINLMTHHTPQRWHPQIRCCETQRDLHIMLITLPVLTKASIVLTDTGSLPKRHDWTKRGTNKVVLMANSEGSLQLKISLLVHNSVRNKNINIVTTYLRTDGWDMKTQFFFVAVKGDSHASGSEKSAALVCNRFTCAE